MENKNENVNRSSMKNLIFCAICCAFTCVCAMLVIPIGVVPITLANLAIYISGALLGPVYGAISQILYLLLVLFGLPFTAKGLAGPSYLVGPTAGYMYGYILIAFLVGWIYKFFGKKSKEYVVRVAWNIVACIVGTIACYFAGTVWFVFQQQTTVSKALAICIYPFLIGDFLKIIVAAIIVPKLERIVKM